MVDRVGWLKEAYHVWNLSYRWCPWDPKWMVRTCVSVRVNARFASQWLRRGKASWSLTGGEFGSDGVGGAWWTLEPNTADPLVIDQGCVGCVPVIGCLCTTTSDLLRKRPTVRCSTVERWGAPQKFAGALLRPCLCLRIHASRCAALGDVVAGA
jgi:hypothetical protein